MPRSFLVIVTGPPASGKTTLAARLAQRYRVPLIAKDLIKEPLLDVIGADDSKASRRLSDASFRVLAATAGAILSAGVSCIVEGNFRAGEHEDLFAPLLRHVQTVAQVLCSVAEHERIARLRARTGDPRRHRGHRDHEQALTASAERADDRFLELPGERLLADDELTATLDALLRQCR